jgi:hypothetical protein
MGFMVVLWGPKLLGTDMQALFWLQLATCWNGVLLLTEASTP